MLTRDKNVHIWWWLQSSNSKCAVVYQISSSSCYSAFLCKISLKSDHWLLTYGQKKRFWNGGRLSSWILKMFIFGRPTVEFEWCCLPNSSKSDDFSLKYGNFTVFTILRWPISVILNFRGPIMGYLKSPCRTSYSSSAVTIALNCLVIE